MAIVFLARSTASEPTQAREVSEYLSLPVDSTLKVLQSLVRQGLIRSTLGRRGGYQFHRAPETLTLLDVVEAIDGPLSSSLPIVDAADRHSPLLTRLAEACSAVNARARQELSRISLAELIDADAPALAMAG